MIHFVFSIGKQPYREVINFVSYIHVVYIVNYNDINFTYLYMRTHYLRHLANIIDIQWSGGGGGRDNSQLNWLTCCKRQKSVETLRLQTNMMQYSK